MIANQELNQKIYALHAMAGISEESYDANGYPSRDYAGSIEEAIKLVEEAAQSTWVGIHSGCYFSSGGNVVVWRCAIENECAEDKTAARAICLAYIAWKERTNEKINQ